MHKFTNDLKIIYHIFITLYYYISGVAALFSRKASLFYSGRKGLLDAIELQMKSIKRDNNPVAWFHCASVGEFEQARPVIEKFREMNPGFKVVLTFFSPSGYELRKNYPLADGVFYLPMDTKSNVSKFLDLVNPSVVIFVKYEFWRNYLLELKRRNINVYLISAIFRESQPFFKKWGGSFREVLLCFTRFFVQDKNSALLLASVGVKNVTVCGDTRFDRVFEIAQRAEGIESLDRFCMDSLCCVAGSTWPADEALIVAHFKEHFRKEKIDEQYKRFTSTQSSPGHPSPGLSSSEQNSPDQYSPDQPLPGISSTDLFSTDNKKFKLIIVPHEVDERQIGKLTTLLNDIPHIRYSELAGREMGERLAASSVLIIDSVGILSKAYKYGSFAYVGGGFGAGIHNILEPATFGLPVVFGPKFSKFREARELAVLEGAFPIKTGEELSSIFDRLISDNSFRNNCSQICTRYVSENRGATQQILKSIKFKPLSRKRKT
ncbi:MAG: 3-deoxy-D-manno-octulosonic acid transferase [Bacteroidales bacterium]